MAYNTNNKKKNNYYYKNNKKNYYCKNKKHNQNHFEKNKHQTTIEDTAKINRELIEAFEPVETLDISDQSNLNEELDEIVNNPFKEEYALEEPILIKKNNKEEKQDLPKIKFHLSPKLGYILGPLLLIIMLLGTTYAWFNYYQESEKQADIQAGEVYVTLKENVTPSITLSKAYPRTVSEARARNDNYVDFTILGKNTSPRTAILYSFVLSDGEEETGKIDTQYLMFDLSLLDENNNETLIADSVNYNVFNSLELSAINNVPINTTSEMSKKYRLRMWVSDSVVISDTEPGATYTQAQFNNLHANISLNVSTSTTKNSIPISINANKSNVENGVSYIRTTISNNYKLEDEGELLSTNDTVVYQVTNPDNLLYFQYVDSRGDEDTTNNESLDLTYIFNKNESVDVKVFTKSRTDSNVDTTIHFKVMKNGNVIKEYDQVVSVVGNNYCINNGFTKLVDCILVSENLSKSKSEAINYINSKGSPNVNVTAPTYTYVERTASDSSITGTTLTTKWYFSDSYSFDSTTGTFALKNSNGNTVNKENNQHELSEDYIGYYTFGSNTTTSGNTISRVTTVDLENNKITTSRITYQIASSLDSEVGLYKAEDDYGDSYIFRGNVSNNNVLFGGYYWKIIRINGDGSIRLIFNGKTLSANGNKTAGNNAAISSTSATGVGATYAFNTMYTGPTFTGYMPSINSTIGETTGVTYSNVVSETEYYFADDYKIVFDSNGPLFQLLGKNNKLVKSTFQNMQNIAVTPYTCLKTTVEGTCSTLYKVNTIDSATSFTGTTYSVSLQMQIATNTTRSSITASTVYYWGDDYELTYDANGPLFKLKKNQYDIVGKTVGQMKDDTAQFAKTPYWCGTSEDGGCRTLHKVTSITSETAFKGDRYHFSPQTKEDSEKNQLDSTAKEQLDAWYETKFMNNQNNGKVVTDYIVDGTFCNDRNITRTSNYNSGYLVTTHTYFAPKTRLLDAAVPNKTATLICANTNDKFSVTSAKGNAKLTYPVALITADEVALAGGKYNEKNENFYLRTNGNFWTMSPSYFSSASAVAVEFYVGSTGLLNGDSVSHRSGLRAVINLKSDTLIHEGYGTIEKPFIIE